MSPRLGTFLGYATHAWYGRLFRKLTKTEVFFAQEFIKRHDHLNFDEFYKLSSRLGLETFSKDVPAIVAGGRNLSLIVELLVLSNNALKKEGE